jgi:hypothetical protein
LEDDTVALGETESLVGALQSSSIGNEAREDGWISWATNFFQNPKMNLIRKISFEI